MLKRYIQLRIVFLIMQKFQFETIEMITGKHTIHTKADCVKNYLGTSTPRDSTRLNFTINRNIYKDINRGKGCLHVYTIQVFHRIISDKTQSLFVWCCHRDGTVC